MSWDSYITGNLMCPVDKDGNTLTSAALLGIDGSVWAKSDTFPDITPEEAEKLQAAMTDNSLTSVTVAGVKYMKIVGEDTLLVARKDKVGFTAKKTNQAIVFGFFTEPAVTSRTCNNVVLSLADYLEKQGY